MKAYVKIFMIMILFIDTPFLLAQSANLSPRIVRGPYECILEGNKPYIFFELEIGEILNRCYIHEKHCRVPWMIYGVFILKQSPSDPDCWCSIFEYIYYYPFAWIHIGDAIIRFAGDTCPYGYDDWRRACCQWGLIIPPYIAHLTGPSFNLDFHVGPVNSGKYLVVVEAVQYPDWECIEDDTMSHWEGQWVTTDKKEVKVTHNLLDYAYWTSLYYVDMTHGDSAYDGQYVDAFGKYKIVAKVMTDKNDFGQAQNWAIGHLRPNGGTERFIRFHRWPEGDYEPPCHWWDYCWYTFAYMSDDDIKPKDLWPYMSDEEWVTARRDMTLCLYGEENNVDNDAQMKVYVQNLLHLDCLNDTTVCFIPANYETMPFVFSYNKYLELTSESDVAFNIQNNRGDLVYLEKVAITDPDPEYPGLYYFTDISWDGRCNKGASAGHLADPEGSPYEAFVSLNTIAAEALRSNIETFDVMPAIDSIIITHEPWNPPPDFMFYPEVHLSSVIVGKIDDQNPPEDYKYYLYHTNSIPPERNHRWDGTSYIYTDGDQPAYDFYENLATANFDNYQKRQWQTTNWGNLRYEWWSINDIREGTSGMVVNYSDKRDTTSFWGSDWEVCIEVPDDEVNRKRLLLFNIIENYKNDYLVQACTSALDEDAHKVIFGPIEGSYGSDNIYWSSSHIGVPYGYGAKTGYKHIDCSGFCIATQIQENGGALYSGGHVIDLGNTNADMLIRDIKGTTGYIAHGLPGHICTTDTIVIADSLAQRGDLIGLNPRTSTPPPWGHIANIAYVVYIPEDGEFESLEIYEAKGHTSESNPGPLNLVRQENCITYYLDRRAYKKIKRWSY